MESANSQQRSLPDLPIGALAHVSSYLPSLPRALFAVALDYYRDIDSSSAIVGGQWDVLDFGDIEKEIAAKLNDDDVRSILLSIDAANNLKTLRLTNLLNITGIGLEPLRGSTMIEKIDLSLVGDNESPDLDPAPPISMAEVLPILDSIIDMGGESSLKLLIFPKEWRKEINNESEFHAFLARYNELLRSRLVTCLSCDYNLSEDGPMVRMVDIQYGTQKYTCYDCLKHYCHDCSEEDEGEIFCMSDVCNICNRRYCLHCSREWQCTCCDGWFCVDCMSTKQCAQCDRSVCSNCISERKCQSDCCNGKIWCDDCVLYSPDGLIPCDNCSTDRCIDCYESSPNEYLNYCNVCDEHLCRECQLIKCKEEMTNYCEGCHRIVLKATLEDKQRQLHEQNRQIQEKERQLQENERLIREMQAEINQLKLAKDMSGESG